MTAARLWLPVLLLAGCSGAMLAAALPDPWAFFAALGAGTLLALVALVTL